MALLFPHLALLGQIGLWVLEKFGDDRSPALSPEPKA
jgi:hypothetical protein